MQNSRTLQKNPKINGKNGPLSHVLEEREDLVYGRNFSFSYEHARSAHFSELIKQRKGPKK